MVPKEAPTAAAAATLLSGMLFALPYSLLLLRFLLLPLLTIPPHAAACNHAFACCSECTMSIFLKMVPEDERALCQKPKSGRHPMLPCACDNIAISAVLTIDVGHQGWSRISTFHHHARYAWAIRNYCIYPSVMHTRKMKIVWFKLKAWRAKCGKVTVAK